MPKCWWLFVFDRLRSPSYAGHSLVELLLGVVPTFSTCSPSNTTLQWGFPLTVTHLTNSHHVPSYCHTPDKFLSCSLLLSHTWQILIMFPLTVTHLTNSYHVPSYCHTPDKFLSFFFSNTVLVFFMFSNGLTVRPSMEQLEHSVLVFHAVTPVFSLCSKPQRSWQAPLQFKLSVSVIRQLQHPHFPGSIVMALSTCSQWFWYVKLSHTLLTGSGVVLSSCHTHVL